MAEDATRRTRLAGERTFLAWWRTSLGATGLGLALGKLVPEITSGPRWPWVALGAAFAIVGAAAAGAGWWRHATLDRRLAGGEEARTPPWLVAAMALLLALAGLLVALLVAVA